MAMVAMMVATAATAYPVVNVEAFTNTKQLSRAMTAIAQEAASYVAAEPWHEKAKKKRVKRKAAPAMPREDPSVPMKAAPHIPIH